jgi:hypothetical protein
MGLFKWQDGVVMTTEELAEHLQTQMPEFQFMHDWKSDLGAHRYYFHHTHEERHILQVSEEILADSSAEELKRKLEGAELKALFAQHPNEIVVLSEKGISFLPLPR